jgi:hypothetical protein
MGEKAYRSWIVLWDEPKIDNKTLTIQVKKKSEKFDNFIDAAIFQMKMMYIFGEASISPSCE